MAAYIEDKTILKNVRDLVREGHYALRPHTVAHMLAEGFEERSII